MARDEDTDDADLDPGGSTRVDIKIGPQDDGGDVGADGGTAVSPMPRPDAPKTPPPRAEHSDSWWQHDASDPSPTKTQRAGVGVDEEPEPEPPRGAALRATVVLEDARKELLSLRRSDDGWGAAPHAPESRDNEVLGTAQKNVDAPRLIVIEGPDLGREFLLSGRDVSIGRAPDNDVVVNDPSVSRLHCRLLVGEDGVVATDQRSGNGTIVSGRRIERQNLRSGNTIKLGQTMFRFVEMGDVIKSTDTSDHQEEDAASSRELNSTPAPRADRSGRYALLIVLGALLTGGAILALALFGGKNSGGERKPNEIAEEAYEAGRLALRAKAFDQAQEKLYFATTAAPAEKRYHEALQQLARERGYARIISDARAKGTAHRWDEAMLQLEDARPTMFAADISAAKEDIRKSLLESVKQASDALDKRSGPSEIKAAEELVRSAGAAFADEASVKQLSKRIGEPPAPPKEEAAPMPNNTTKFALSSFIAGRAETALAELGAQSDEASIALRNKISKFQELIEDARSAVLTQRPDAEAAVKKALAFEGKIAQGKSTYLPGLRRLQADALADSGVRYLNEQKYIEAYRACKDALAIDRDQPTAKRKLQEVQAQARDAFNQGYILKDSDRAAAREKWARVLTMVPPEDDIYKKAKKRLEQSQ